MCKPLDNQCEIELVEIYKLLLTFDSSFVK